MNSKEPKDFTQPLVVTFIMSAFSHLSAVFLRESLLDEPGGVEDCLHHLQAALGVRPHLHTASHSPADPANYSQAPPPSHRCYSFMQKVWKLVESLTLASQPLSQSIVMHMIALVHRAMET